MATWAAFAREAPDLARIGHERLEDRVASLATLDAKGAPRVHPVGVWFQAGGLFVRMYPNSPKTRDLDRDPRYAMHSLMDNMEGEGGEFAIRGRAARVIEPKRLADATEERVASERYVVYEFEVSEALATSYAGDRTVRTRWREGQATRPGEPSAAE
jgi:hypothetical protein